MSYPEQADPMSAQDHPAHNFSDRVKLAGDVIPMNQSWRRDLNAWRGQELNKEIIDKGKPIDHTNLVPFRDKK